MVFGAEGHLALGVLKLMPSMVLMSLLVAVSPLVALSAVTRARRRKTPGGEEVRRGLEFLVVGGHQRFVHRVLRMPK